MRRYLDACQGDIQVEFLPAYAPELNPPEYLFGHLKPRELGNFRPKGIDELKHYARRRLRSMQRRPTRVSAFWKQDEPPL